MSRRTLDETLDCIAAIDRAPSPDAISEVILDVVRPFGFTRLLAGIVPTPGMTMQQQIANIVLHCWPERWSQRYLSRGYISQDPIIRRISASTEPFLWSEIRGAYLAGPAARRIMNEAREFELGCGFTVPMITLDGRSVGLSIAGSRAELPPRLRGGLQLLAIYGFARAISIPRAPPPVKLTTRETDVLRWIAEGKTDWEISKILHVSEHLVDKVARQIRCKFGSTNRIHAVAQALRQQIIQ